MNDISQNLQVQDTTWPFWIFSLNFIFSTRDSRMFCSWGISLRTSATPYQRNLLLRHISWNTFQSQTCFRTLYIYSFRGQSGSGICRCWYNNPIESYLSQQHACTKYGVKSYVLAALLGPKELIQQTWVGTVRHNTISQLDQISKLPYPSVSSTGTSTSAVLPACNRNDWPNCINMSAVHPSMMQF